MTSLHTHSPTCASGLSCLSGKWEFSRKPHDEVCPELSHHEHWMETAGKQKPYSVYLHPSHHPTPMPLTYSTLTKILSMKYASPKGHVASIQYIIFCKQLHYMYLEHFPASCLDIIFQWLILFQLLKSNWSWYLVFWKKLITLAISSCYFQIKMSQHKNKHGGSSWILATGSWWPCEGKQDALIGLRKWRFSHLLRSDWPLKT